MTSTKVNVEALYATLDRERDHRGISWRELARQANVSPSTLSRIRNGDAMPSVEALVSLSAWLGIPVDEFIQTNTRAVKQPSLTAQLGPLLRARKDLSPQEVDYLESVIEAASRHFKATRQRA